MNKQQLSPLEQYRNKRAKELYPQRDDNVEKYGRAKSLGIAKENDYNYDRKVAFNKGFDAAIALANRFNKWMKDPEIDPKYFENIPKTRENLLGYFVTFVE